MDNFSELRDEWVRKGRPSDETDPYWASVVAAQARPRPRFVAPLVAFGG